MEAMKKAAVLALAVMIAASGAARAGDYDWDDIFAPYRQRIDSATTSSGNAVNVNAATHVIAPWPPYARQRHIPGDGARMVGAVERYREPRVPATPPAQLRSPIMPAPNTRPDQSSATGNSGNQSATAGQPAGLQ
jgi:hypothetical protein